jgi:splicing factor 1
MALQQKKVHTRWGSEGTVKRLPNITTAIIGPMTAEQIDAYVLHVRIEELNQKLKSHDIMVTNRGHRSPSPAPLYNASGVRTNTRYRRHRTRLEDEYHSLIQVALRTIPNYRVTHGHVPRRTEPSLITEKVYIPVREFPEVNFIGQLLGPRGRSLAELNTGSGAKIAIRGKGSVKEGRARGRRCKYSKFDDHQEEPLHCLILADTQEKVDKAKALIHLDIERAVTMPEHANERKRQQLRDLAIINGTLRDDERLGGDGNSQSSGKNGSNSDHIAGYYPARKTVAPWRSVTNQTGNKVSGQETSLDIAYRQFESELKGFITSPGHII